MQNNLFLFCSAQAQARMGKSCDDVQIAALAGLVYGLN